MKRNRLFFVTTAMLATIGMCGCTQETEEVVPLSNSVERSVESSIDKARDFFATEAGATALPDVDRQVGRPAVRSAGGPLLTTALLIPDWPRAWVTDLSPEPVVVTDVPVEVTAPILYATLIEELGATASFTVQPPRSRLLIYEPTDGTPMYIRLTTFLPDASWIGDVVPLAADPTGSDYSGVVLYSHPDGTPEWGWRYRNGEVVNTLLFGGADPAQGDPNVHVSMEVGMGEEATTRTEPDWVISLDPVYCEPSGGGGGLSGGYYGGFVGGRPGGIPGGGGSSGGYHNGGMYGGGGRMPLGPQQPPSSSVPLARAILKGNLTEAQWRQVEAMVDKILKDCLGSHLYDGLLAKMNGAAWELRYDPGASSGTFGSSYLTINDLNDPYGLMHELFHGYQAYGESVDSFNGATANMEVEAQIAKVMFMLDGNDSEEFSRNYRELNNDPERDAFLYLQQLINPRGQLWNSGDQQRFDQGFYSAGQFVIRQDPSMYRWDASRASFGQSMKNIVPLAAGC